MDLQTVWFVLIAVLFAGYAVLDGFDFGVGALHLFAKKEEERRVLLNAIGPFWDGNEVWLVVGGGALFAAFPEVYATLFSGFYLAFMLLLFSLILRAVAIEFRSKENAAAWRSLWDVVFSASSILASLIWGVAAANLVQGIPLRADREFHGSFLSLFHPFSLLAGVSTVALFMLHAAAYLTLKSEGELRDRAKRWGRRALVFFLTAFVLTFAVAFLTVPNIRLAADRVPLLWSFLILFILTVWRLSGAVRQGGGRAFLLSGLTIVCLVAAAACGLFPNLILSEPYPQYSLSVYNASSSPKTLGIMLVIAAVALPLVLVYTVFVHRVFRGKVRLDPSSY